LLQSSDLPTFGSLYAESVIVVGGAGAGARNLSP